MEKKNRIFSIIHNDNLGDALIWTLIKYADWFIVSLSALLALTYMAFVTFILYLFAVYCHVVIIVFVILVVLITAFLGGRISNTVQFLATVPSE